MFREMRRKKQLLSQEETVEIMEKGTSGVLALIGDDSYPYALPLSYVYCNSKIYFHSSKVGHKIDAIKNSQKASFCVIDKDHVVPEEYTSYFRSAIAFGRVRIIENDKEKISTIEKLVMRYTLGNEERRSQIIAKQFNSFCMIELEIEHMTGKQAIELVRKE